MRTLIKLGLLTGMGLASALGQVSTTQAAEYTIILDHMKFGELPAQLHVGDTITWQNNDLFRHTATARDNSFDVDLPAKSSTAITVDVAGSVDFYCRFHPGMKGTLVIAP